MFVRASVCFRLLQLMCREAPKAVTELENYGLPFSRTGA